MKNLSKLFIPFLLFQFTSLAQAPDTMWTKTFGGVGGDVGNVIIETYDNGFIVGGATSESNNSYSYVIRLNHIGNTLWTSTSCYDTTYECRCSVAPSLYEINPGHYIMTFAGITGGLLRVKANGDSVQYYKLWYYGMSSPSFNNMCKTNDGNYILSYFYLPLSSGCIQKADSLGNEIWHRHYESGFSIYYVIQSDDSGYTILGGTGSNSVALRKIDNYGDTIWTSIVYQDTIQLRCLEQATDGGYLILGGGYNSQNGNYDDIRLVRTNKLGNFLWSKTYGGIGNDFGGFLTKTPDGGYIIVSSTKSFGAGGSDVWLLKGDSLGNTQWTKTLGGTEDDYGNYVQVTSDGGYIVTGSTNSYGQGESDVWVIKLAPDPLLNIEPNNNIVISDYKLAQNFPNPFNPTTTIKYQVPKISFVTIKVYDVLGREVITLVNEEKSVGTYEITWFAENLPSGVYFYKLKAGSFVETKKMVLMK